MTTSKTRAAALCALLATSCVAAPAAADTRRDKLPQIYTVTPMGVNLQTGMFMRSKTDLSIGTLSFVRSWRTVPSDSTSGDHHNFGLWNHNFGFSVSYETTDTETLANVDTAGQRVRFILVTGGSSNPVWQPYDLDATGTLLTGGLGMGNPIFRNRNGDVFYMNADHRAERVEYADGTRLDLTYNSQKMLRTALSNRGDAIVIDYGGNGKISAACGYNRATHYVGPNTTCAASPLKVAYTYAIKTYTVGGSTSYSTVLASVTDLRNQVTSLQYDNYVVPNLTCITIPGSLTCDITNEYNDQGAFFRDVVVRQTDATGRIWNYSAGAIPQYEHPQLPGEIREWDGTMVDPGGFLSGVHYINGYPSQATTREGIVLYEWDGTAVKKFTYPEGNSVILERDPRQNVTSHIRRAKPNSGLADIVSTASYDTSSGWMPTGCDNLAPKVCNKPIFSVDERNGRTDYTYDPAHGGVLTEAGPAVNGVRPTKRYVYEQRYAGVKSSSGAIVAAVSPVWLLVEEAVCKTQASCQGTTDEVRTVYEYGASETANALRLRGKVIDAGTGRLNLRSCVGFDDQGNAISGTTARASLSTCP